MLYEWRRVKGLAYMRHWQDDTWTLLLPPWGGRD